jgi:hypothetical protein
MTIITITLCMLIGAVLSAAALLVVRHQEVGGLRTLADRWESKAWCAQEVSVKVTRQLELAKSHHSKLEEENECLRERSSRLVNELLQEQSNAMELRKALENARNSHNTTMDCLAKANRDFDDYLEAECNLWGLDPTIPDGHPNPRLYQAIVIARAANAAKAIADACRKAVEEQQKEAERSASVKATEELVEAWSNRVMSERHVCS